MNYYIKFRISEYLKQLGKLAVAIFTLMIGLYQTLISPITPRNCRYQPTCSQYALEALNTYGFLAGTTLMIRRCLRCHPFGGEGYDPVPRKLKSIEKKLTTVKT